jgi:hypothetical protein
MQLSLQLSKLQGTTSYFDGNMGRVGVKSDTVILGLLGMYFDAVVVEVKTFLLLFRLALAILCLNLSCVPRSSVLELFDEVTFNVVLSSTEVNSVYFTLVFAGGNQNEH